MSGVIDSFVVEWILNPAKYLAGQKKIVEANAKTRTEEEKAAKAREAENKRAAESVAKLRNEVVGLFLTFQGASSIKSFVSDMLAGDAATGRLAKNLNVSTNELSAWQLAVRSAGGEAADANAAFSVMAQLLQNFRNTGLTGQESNLRALGLGPGDLSNPAEALLKLADAKERFEKTDGKGAGDARFYGLAKQIGIPDSVINTLDKGRVELTRQIAELERHGAATDEDARKAEEFQKKWVELQGRLSSTVRPEIYKLVTVALDLVNAIEEGTQEVPGLTAVLGPLVIAAVALESPFIAAGIAIVALLDHLGDLEKAYAHVVFATHGWIGGGALYNQMVAAGVKSNADIDRIIDADRGKSSGGGGGGGGSASYSGLTGDARTRAIRQSFPGYQAPRGRGGGGTANVEDVYQYFRQQGYSDAAARGIAAGIYSESGGDHTRINPSSGAYGLAQWLTKGRLADFRRTYGHDISQSSRSEQLAFIAKELRTSEGGTGARLRNAQSASEALSLFVRGYERPGPGVGGDLRRGASYLASRGAGGGGGGPITINGGVTVNTAATDADGIAKAIVPAIRRRATTTQANRGLD